MIHKELWWKNKKFSPVDINSPWFFMLIYHLGMNNMPVGGRISETQSRLTDMVNIIIIIETLITQLFAVTFNAIC
jgi:hypothetical protein